MAKNPMPDVMVVLPGIMGSILTKNGTVVWGFGGKTIGAALFSRGDSIARDLTLHADDPQRGQLDDGIVASELMPDIHLLPGFWRIDGYTALTDTIKDRFDVVEGENFFRFPYDWRRDLRSSARRLARQSHDWLKNWRSRKNNEAKLVLVAHSMGGLVSRYFLEVLDGWKDTRALISIGTPYRGSLNAVDALANGLRKGPAGLIDLSAMARSFTGIYQLLPIYGCIDDGSGQLAEISKANVSNIDQARASAARAFHREIEEAVNAHLKNDAYMRDRYVIAPIVGLTQQTLQSAKVTGKGVAFVTSYKGKDMSGDGTVPRVSATPLEMPTQTSAMFASTKHGSLQNAAAVLTHIEGVVTALQVDFSKFRAGKLPAVKLALSVDDVFWTDEPIKVRAQPSNSVSSLSATLSSAVSEKVIATAPMMLAEDGWFEAEFSAQVADSYRITVAGATTVEPASDVFVTAMRPR